MRDWRLVPAEPVKSVQAVEAGLIPGGGALYTISISQQYVASLFLGKHFW